jgi:hypothetical protein
MVKNKYLFNFTIPAFKQINIVWFSVYYKLIDYYNP